MQDEDEFAVDGCGNVIRVGDDVEVFQGQCLWSGAGRLESFQRSRAIGVIADVAGRDGQVHAHPLSYLKRADDLRRDGRGRPFWV